MTDSSPMPPHRFAVLFAFLRAEAAAGVTLILAAIVAMVWSNTGAVSAYDHLLHWPLPLGLSFERWVNDGLMAVFFLQVGLEIRRELTEGHLASLPQAAAPAIAAVGGMVVPALIFLAINRHSPETLRGWAIPVATDIAFALAALSVLGGRVPLGLKVFLTALAIIDDLGAIIVIALFYSTKLDMVALAVAALIWAGLWVVSRMGIRALSLYLLCGVVLWYCVLHSGIHATLAGVALAFVIPMRHTGTSPAHRLEHHLGPWVTWIVLPMFGLTNAGLRFGDISTNDLISPVILGIVLGLFFGKQIGVFATTAIFRRLGLIRLPAGLTLAHIYAAAILCGIGFTMSLFIGDLSFGDSPAIHAQVKLAVFVGSLVSAGIGLCVLAAGTRPERQPPSAMR